MQSLTRFALSAPRTTLALVFVVTLVAALGLPRSTTRVGYRAMLGDDHPAIGACEADECDATGTVYGVR